MKQDMIESVRNYLLQFGKVDERVLEAMDKIDRKYFIELPDKEIYIDSAMPIKSGQTISQPSTVARMLCLLELEKGLSVLEIGTGSGWNVALISYLVNPGNVLSLEFYEELIKQAKENIKKIGIKNIKIRKEDFRKVKEKFDRIVFTAGIIKKQEKEIIKFAKRHLKEGGILICPYQRGRLMIVRITKGKIKRDYTEEEYVFVPLLS